MKVGALIVAAGMSSRMGAFKPMLKVGSISIAQRIIATFKKSGVNKIVMVTGYNAEALEKHLAGKGIIFLRNENYENTQMIDSVKIGLAYLKDRCDKVFLSPVDIPLFSSDTIKKLLTAKSPFACPVCENKTGHPLLIANSAINDILNYRGDGGLRGAIDKSCEKLETIEVFDKGTLFDADTKEDFSRLLEYHTKNLARAEINISLAKEKVFFDSKTASLLSLIDETKSVRAAAKKMSLSYSSCWKMVKVLEEQLTYPLITRTQGGTDGGRSVLTQKGKEFLLKYAEFEKKITEFAGSLFTDCFKGML